MAKRKIEDAERIRNAVNSVLGVLVKNTRWEDVDIERLPLLSQLFIAQLREPKEANAALKFIMEFIAGKAGVAPVKKERPSKIEVSFQDNPDDFPKLTDETQAQIQA